MAIPAHIARLRAAVGHDLLLLPSVSVLPIDPAGRLRILRGPADLEDYAEEVSPLAGTMLAFRRSNASFHGHQAHIGRRQSIQLNWVTDAAVVRRELGRHVWSARLKALNPFGARAAAG